MGAPPAWGVWLVVILCQFHLLCLKLFIFIVEFQPFISDATLLLLLLLPPPSLLITQDLTTSFHFKEEGNHHEQRKATIAKRKRKQLQRKILRYLQNKVKRKNERLISSKNGSPPKRPLA